MAETNGLPREVVVWSITVDSNAVMAERRQDCEREDENISKCAFYMMLEEVEYEYVHRNSNIWLIHVVHFLKVACVLTEPQ